MDQSHNIENVKKDDLQIWFSQLGFKYLLEFVYVLSQ